MDIYLTSHTDDAASRYLCNGCERRFAGPGPLNFHRRSCRKTKHRLQGVLANAKEVWEARKKSKGLSLAEVRMLDGSIPDPSTLTARHPISLETTSGRNSTTNGTAEAPSMTCSQATSTAAIDVVRGQRHPAGQMIY